MILEFIAKITFSEQNILHKPVTDHVELIRAEKTQVNSGSLTVKKVTTCAEPALHLHAQLSRATVNARLGHFIALQPFSQNTSPDGE